MASSAATPIAVADTVYNKTDGTVSASKFDRTGTMYKLSLHLGQWQERIFSLSIKKKTLYYFRSQAEYKQFIDFGIPSYAAGIISVQNSSVYVCDFMNAENRPWVFELCTLEMNYLLQAASKEEMTGWVNSFASAGARVKTSDGSKATEKVPYIREFGKQGYLEKRGEWNKSFKKRFFRTLENAAGKKCLVYYTGITDAKPNGFIVLPGAQIINHTEDNAGPTEFAIIEKRKYVLKAASADDKKEWMAALQVLAAGDGDKIFAADRDPSKTKTFYDVLGLEPSASPDLISKAFRQLSKKLHPDRNAQADAKEQFQRLNEAYDMLGDVDHRKRYDEECVQQGIFKQEQLYRPNEVAGVHDEDAVEVSSPPAPRSPTDGKTNAANLNARPRAKSKRTEAAMDKEQKTSRLLNKATNFCEHCGQKLKAMYCVQCDIDCCVSCSSSLHQSELWFHKRVVMQKKDEYLAKCRDPSTVEYREMKDMEEQGRRLSETTGAMAANAVETVRSKAEKVRREQQEVEDKRLREEQLKNDPVAQARAAALEEQARKQRALEAEIAKLDQERSAKIKQLEEERKALVIVGQPTAVPALMAGPSTDAAATSQQPAGWSDAGRYPRGSVEQTDQFKATLREQQTSSSSAYLADVKSLEDGVEVWKIPRSGDAKKTKLYLKKHRDQWEVSWDSHKRNKDEAALKLSEVEVVFGQETPLFKEKRHQQQFGTMTKLSFSLVGAKRSLDVVTLNDEDYRRWHTVLHKLKVERSAATVAATAST